MDSDDIYLIVSKNGQYGVVKNKDVVIDFAYQSISYNSETTFFKVERSGQYGVLNSEGDTVLNTEYKSITFNGEYIYAQTYTESLYFNTAGEKVETDYISIHEVESIGYYVTINDNSLYGIIDSNGNEIVANEYLYIEYAFDDYFIAYKSGQGLGVIDKQGNVCVEFEYDVLSKIGDNKLLKGVDMENNVTDIFSSNMEKLVSLENATIEINSTYIEVYNSSSVYYITSEGEIKTAKEIFTDNKLFSVYKDGKWGFEDIEGNEIVACTYDYVTEFNRYGFAGVMIDGLWGVIDEEGNIVCECIFSFESDDENVKPEFIGKYYKTYSENNEIYYTDEIQEM